MSEFHKTPDFGAPFASRLARHPVVRKAISFGAIGVVNALVDLLVFLAALAVLADRLPGDRMVLVAANVIAWIVAVSGSYVMNSYITFAVESGRKLRWRSYFAFVGSGILGVVAATLTLVVCAEFAPVIVAKLFAIGVGFLVNFSMSHFVVFRPRKDGAQVSEPATSES